MNDDRQQTTEEAAERAFGARIAQHYGPPENTPAERVAFSTAIDRRLARRRRQRTQLAAGMAFAALAWLTLLLLPAALPDGPASAPTTVASSSGPIDAATSATSAAAGASTAGSEGWDYEVWYAGDLLGSDDADDDGLPADYAALAGAFLDG